jgi:hypothetical protein
MRTAFRCARTPSPVGASIRDRSRARALGSAATGLDDAALARISWLHLQAANDGESILSVLADGFSFLESNNAYTLHLFTESVPPLPSLHNWLELRRTSDGSLALWIGEAPSVQELRPPPEVRLLAGSARAQRDDECRSSLEPALEAQVGTSTVSVPRHERAAIGPWQVTNGGVTARTAAGGCAAAPLLRVAIWPSRQ